MTKYRKNSWVSPKIEVKNSSLGGKGLFVKESIKEGKVLMVWGGTLMVDDQINKNKLRPQSIAYVGENEILADFMDEEDSPDNYLNHSCDPNLWMKDEVTVSAIRDIASGEEVTVDYAMFEGDEEHISKWECHCGSNLCRGKVTGGDWRLPELQKKYQNHSSPFINERIRKLKSHL